jgi:hypothetical protein
MGQRIQHYLPANFAGNGATWLILKHELSTLKISTLDERIGLLVTVEFSQAVQFQSIGTRMRVRRDHPKWEECGPAVSCEVSEGLPYT